MSGSNYIIVFFRKITRLFSILVFSTFGIFVLIRLAPGDPYAGWPESSKIEFYANENLVVQYTQWFEKAMILDFGCSLKTGNPVTKEVIIRYTRTLLLVVCALIMALLVSLFIAVILVYKNSHLIKLLRSLLEFISIVPAYILGILIFTFLNDRFGIFHYDFDLDPFKQILLLITMILILIFGNGVLIELIRNLKNELLNVKNQLFMKAVVARKANYRKHIIRTLIRFILTMAQNRIIFLLNGAIIVEFIWSFPAIGTYCIEAASARDYPAIMAIIFFTVVLIFSIKLLFNILINQITQPKPVLKKYV